MSHFTLEELTTTGKHPGLDNTPGPLELANLEKLQAKLEELRAILCAHFGREVPVGISYGLRMLPLNYAVGGSVTSAHLEGLAADTIYPNGPSIDEVFQILRSHPSFMADVDQLIIERGCIHLGLPCRASLYRPRRELRGEATVGSIRRYPLIAVWARANAAEA